MKASTIKDIYLFNLPIKAEVGDVVLYNSYNDHGDEVQKEVQIIGQDDFQYFYEVNKHGIKIGFHKSRLVKIVKSKSGQCQIFNQP
jgi:hypothetical protein